MGGFQEADKGMGTFPEDDKTSFDLLLKWVYYGTLPLLV